MAGILLPGRTVVVLGTFGVGAALADSSSTTTTSTTPPGPPQSQQEATKLFLSGLASTLGISEDTLTTDLETAYKAAISQEVTDGTITQTQADQILSNLDKDGASLDHDGSWPRWPRWPRRRQAAAIQHGQHNNQHDDQLKYLAAVYCYENIPIPLGDIFIAK